MTFRTTALALAACCAFATPTLADVDPCLVGSWLADPEDMDQVMSQTLQGDVWITGGSAVWDIPPSGEFRLTVDNLTMNVQIAGAPPFELTIDGYSAGMIDTVDGAFDAIVSEFDLVGRAAVLGDVLEYPFDSSTGAFGSGSGIYGCTETGLALEQAGRPGFPRHWTR